MFNQEVLTINADSLLIGALKSSFCKRVNSTKIPYQVLKIDKIVSIVFHIKILIPFKCSRGSDAILKL